MTRFFNRTAVKAGLWYYVATCSGCDKLIYLFHDPHGDKRHVTIDGGSVETTCPRCAHENVYSSKELFLVQSEEDLPGTQPPRVAISKSSRKPLWIAYPKARAIMGTGLIEDRPKAAVIIARIVTSWADIEVDCARLLAQLMGTNIPAAAAVFGSIRSSRTQHDALEAAARAVLNEADFELFSAHMSRKASLEKERNDLAHGCFGFVVNLPDDIVWVAQADLIEFTANAETDPHAEDVFRKKQSAL